LFGQKSDHLTFTCRQWRDDVTYAVEVTGTVGSGCTNTGVTDTPVGDNLKATDPEAISANTTRFILLKITWP
jgi:hypothetical protein